MKKIIRDILYIISFFVIAISYFLFGDIFLKQIISDFSEKNIFVILVFLFGLGLSILNIDLIFDIFILSLPIEIIDIKVPLINLDVKTYQIISVFLFFGVFVNLFRKKYKFGEIKPKIVDGLLLLFVIFSMYSSIINNYNKFAIIILHFYLLYIITRFIISSEEKIWKFLRIFLITSACVAFFALIQNYFAINDIYQNTVMNARPNATFLEPDWLGIFLVIGIAGAIGIFLKNEVFFVFSSNKKETLWSVMLIFIISAAIIITVSRSAWLAVILLLIFVFISIFLKLKFKEALSKIFKLLLIIIASYLLVIYGNFTSFSIFDRFSSTTTTKQKITISCTDKSIGFDEISDINKLSEYGCKHINLEDINKEKSSGRYIFEIMRPDPNINIRKKIYKDSWEAIKDNWIFGYGWGSSGEILGKDPSGTSLNASNIFLEIWLSSGIVGFLFFFFAIAIILIDNIKTVISNYKLKTNNGFYSTLALMLFIALFVPNMFNVSILSGTFWIVLALIVSLNKQK